MYYCLSGQFPHPMQPTPIADLAVKMVEPPRPLGPLAPGVSKTVVNAVMRALSMQPEDRFATCSAFAAAVGGGAVVASAEEPPGPRAEKEHRAAAPTSRLAGEPEPLPRTVILEEEGHLPTEATPRLAAEPQPLAETVRLQEEHPPPAASSSAIGRRQPAGQRQPAARPWPSGRPQPEFLPRPPWRAPPNRRPPVVERRSAADEGALVLVWNTLKWILAFSGGYLILSDGSYFLFELVNLLASVDTPLGLPALEDQAALLVAGTAAGNMSLGLLAGYAVGVICNQHWKSNCVALAAVAVALTGWEAGFRLPLVDSWASVDTGFGGVWLSMAALPLGLLAGAYARSLQTRARPLGAFLAMSAVAIVIALRLFPIWVL